MSSVHPAVDFVLDRLGPVVDAQPEAHPLVRVDRDNSQTYDGSASVDMTEAMHERQADLESANYVGATFANQTGELVGTEPMQDTDVVVGVRVEGLHHSEWGHVDPDGAEGVPFDQLVADVRSAIWGAVQYPDAGPSNVSYRHLSIGNDDPQSAGWKDFFRHSMDVTFTGYEEIDQ